MGSKILIYVVLIILWKADLFKKGWGGGGRVNPKPKHKVPRLTTGVDISRLLMSFRKGTDDHQIRGSRLDIGLCN